MAESTYLAQLTLNVMTQKQYNDLTPEEINEDELYLTIEEDEQESL